MNNRNIIILFCLVWGISSCTWGLEELPVFQEAELTDFWFEYREIVTKTYPNGDTYESLEFTDLKNASSMKLIENASSDSSDVVVTLESTSLEKDIVLDNLTGKATISTGATLSPVGDSPKLGQPGDFSREVTFKVTAADGKNVHFYNVSVLIK